MATEQLEQATLAGGCFWCLEAVFHDLRGVKSAISGYTGGRVENPTYQAVCGGGTGHAEVVQVTYDASQLSYRDLLNVFFAIHDPTTKDRQGNDVGTQYRSAIYTHNAEQGEIAHAVVAELESQKLFAAPFVTEITPLPRFYEAEEYHQRYFERNPHQPYCAAVVGPKLGKFRKQFLDKLAR
jgi:peptide-methionine (S)-S-oxide reductase